MPDERLIQKAIDNNHGLYRAIFDCHGISFHVSKNIAYTLQPPLPLYSNLVTRTPTWQPDDIFGAIDVRHHQEGWETWSVKDSFGELNLNPYGFEKLLVARWIHLDRTQFTPKQSDDLDYRFLNTANDLSRWVAGWNRRDQGLGHRLFPANLLSDPALFFVGGFVSDRLLAGAILNTTDDVVGISNFFSPSPAINYWSSMVKYIEGAFEGRNVVGFEDISLCEELDSIGFESLGNLAVWLKRDTVKKNGTNSTAHRLPP